MTYIQGTRIVVILMLARETFLMIFQSHLKFCFKRNVLGITLVIIMAWLYLNICTNNDKNSVLGLLNIVKDG